MSRPSRRVTFPGGAGVELSARLDLPAGPPRAYALFAHCFTCSKDLAVAGRIAGELNARRIAVLRFDFTGLGRSGGEFADTNFSTNLEDLRCAAAWLRAEHHAPQLLVGHSLGGAAVLAVAAELAEVRAVATIGAPSSPEHVEHLFVGDLDRIERDGEATVDIGGRPFTVKRQLLDDLRSHSVLDGASRLDAALLVLHSPVDNIVGVANAAAIHTAARHPKSFVSLDGADHLLTRREDALFAARLIAEWARRYLVDEHPEAIPPAATAPVVVAETGQSTFLNHVVAGDHHFLVDEPDEVGGFDAGPSPYDLLGAALGACTSMTLRLYAERKNLPLTRVTVEVAHHKVHREDRDACAAGHGAFVDRFDRRIGLEGPLSADQQAALLAIADRCPVHRTLEAGARIVTEAIPPTT